MEASRIKNHFTIRERLNRFRRRMKSTWLTTGWELVKLVSCGVIAGMLLGGALLALAWR